jgi:hypothetical protein
LEFATAAEVEVGKKKVTWLSYVVAFFFFLPLSHRIYMYVMYVCMYVCLAVCVTDDDPHTQHEIFRETPGSTGDLGESMPGELFRLRNVHRTLFALPEALQNLTTHLSPGRKEKKTRKKEKKAAL